MGIEISIKDDYILVEPPKGVIYWDILEGLTKIYSLVRDIDKNDIWVFRDGPVILVYEDLFKIRDLICEHYPTNVRRNKTALVVETGIQLDLAENFAEIADELPFETKVFSDIRSAEDWITC